MQILFYEFSLKISSYNIQSLDRHKKKQDVTAILSFIERNIVIIILNKSLQCYLKYRSMNCFKYCQKKNRTEVL